MQIRDLGSAGFDRKWKNVDKLEPDSASIREMDKDVRYWEIDVVRAKTLGLEKKFLHLQGLCVPADDTGFFEVVKTVKQAHDEAEAKMIKATEKILKRSPPLRSHGRL